MCNQNNNDYQEIKDLILKHKGQKYSWTEMRNISFTEDSPEEFIKIINKATAENIDFAKWKELVDELERFNDSSSSFNEDEEGNIASNGFSNHWTPCNEKGTLWEGYIQKLEEKGFSDQSIDSITKATEKTMNQLRTVLPEDGPMKGMVVGNVQSGKTANIAGLMAAAADYGFNLFIILTGTIENLRSQTDSRLSGDLYAPTGNLSWEFLSDEKGPSAIRKAASKLYLDPSKDIRYAYVCLKQRTNLIKLIKWLHSESNQVGKMKILVIDDEADQAGVNTKNIKKSEQTVINSLISNLVSGKKYDGVKDSVDFLAMNYIGYTATPYANVLNEIGEETLYPKDFIQTLDVSNEYFGPQQIFGEDIVYDEDPEYPVYQGMNIIREVSLQDINKVKKISREDDLPYSLKTAIAWFLCSVAALRYKGYKKPLTLLIHTSVKVNDHRVLADKIESVYKEKYVNNPLFFEFCREIWNQETDSFSLARFNEECTWYGQNPEDYPAFEEIIPELQLLLKRPITQISFDGEKRSYSSDVMLCVDNTEAGKRAKSAKKQWRIIYPDEQEEKNLEKAPAFIVIGGNTLSRGLTLKGLVCSFFLRSTHQADTLMQMGRWFGYRHGYELYPRIWMSEQTRLSFKILSNLDGEFRYQIKRMQNKHVKPTDYPPFIKKYTKVQPTSKNKMQSGKVTRKDYFGKGLQVTTYLRDAEVQNHNLHLFELFVNSLGKPEQIMGASKGVPNMVWKNISFSIVSRFLREYKGTQLTENEINEKLAWMEMARESDNDLNHWNIILANNSKGQKWPSQNGIIGMVTRTALNQNNDYINIGALVDMKDYLGDINFDENPAADKEKNDFLRNKKRGGEARVAEIRNLTEYRRRPVLLMYLIDKNSVPRQNGRYKLNSVNNLVGISILIPHSKDGSESGEYYRIIPDYETLLNGLEYELETEE